MMNFNANINLKEFNNYQDMMSAVTDHIAATGCSTNFGTLYVQGGRFCLQTALSLPALTATTSANRPSNKGKTTPITDVQKSTNRPLDPAHAKSIGDYITKAKDSNTPYILPSLTLNFNQRIDVFTIKGTAAAKAAVMVMPLGARMEITDGQHRVEGVAQALAKCEACSGDSIGAMITFTEDHAQVHQDFADCARTKAISPSQLVVYDRRNPANGLVLDLIENAALFSSTVDSVKQSISARSTAVWSTNQIRVMLKWALIGAQCSDQVFADNAATVLGERGHDSYRNFLSGLLTTLECISDRQPTLRKLSDLTQERLDEIPRIREQDDCLLMSGSGLAVMGFLWFKVRKLKIEQPQADTQILLNRIAAVDWSNKSPLFSDNLKINPDRTQSGQKYVRMAGEKIWSHVAGEYAQQENIAA